MCIRCRSLDYLQCCTLEAILIMKNSLKVHEWVCENCHFKEVPFPGLHEFQEITVISPTAIGNVEYEKIHILNFKNQRKHLSTGHVNTQSMISSFDEFHVLLQGHTFDLLTLS